MTEQKPHYALLTRSASHLPEYRITLIPGEARPLLIEVDNRVFKRLCNSPELSRVFYYEVEAQDGHGELIWDPYEPLSDGIEDRPHPDAWNPERARVRRLSGNPRLSENP